MNHEVEVILDSRLSMTDDRLNDEKKTPDLPSDTHDTNCLPYQHHLPLLIK